MYSYVVMLFRELLSRLHVAYLIDYVGKIEDRIHALAGTLVSASRNILIDEPHAQVPTRRQYLFKPVQNSV